MLKKIAAAGLVASMALAAGCRDRNAGMGGAGREGVDIGNRPGVINDGEGPLEENKNPNIGNNPGIINDGEGPLENGRGPLEDNMNGNPDIGDRPGVINDGEGPIENNR
jgi:hypothetical protein